MLTGVHFLLTFTCTMSCDHCFLYCGPNARGTMTMEQIDTVLGECRALGTVQDVYFEGGEPFLYYAVMLEGIRRATAMGFKAGIVTNGYWATLEGDAEVWLRPLAELGLSNLSISDDELHGSEVGNGESATESGESAELEVPHPKPHTPYPIPSPFPKNALAAAKRLGIPAHPIAISKPHVTHDTTQERGAPQIGGSTRLRGRAVEKLTDGLPMRTCTVLTECRYEDLADPKRVHVDCYGDVLVCQGISIGNCFLTPFSQVMASYDPLSHPICGPLLRGGPAALATEHGLSIPEAIDECHLCYVARLALMDRFPEYLAPRQVYGGEG